MVKSRIIKEEKMEERLTLKINNKKVIVDHNYDKETGKPFREQKGGTGELKKWLFEEIVYNNKDKGWQTYNNFECSFDWKVVV